MKYRNILFVLACLGSLNSTIAQTSSSEENLSSKDKLILLVGYCWSMGTQKKMVGDAYFSGETEKLRSFPEIETQTINDLKAGKYKSPEDLASTEYNDCLQKFELGSDQEKQASQGCYKALEIHWAISKLKDSGIEQQKVEESISGHYGKTKEDYKMLGDTVSDIYSAKDKKEVVTLMHAFFYSCVKQAKENINAAHVGVGPAKSGITH